MLRKAFWEQMKPKLWDNHFWSPSYCVVSVGGATLDVIKQFIENQRNHSVKNKLINQKKYRLKADGLLDSSPKETGLSKPSVQIA